MKLREKVKVKILLYPLKKADLERESIFSDTVGFHGEINSIVPSATLEVHEILV